MPNVKLRGVEQTSTISVRCAEEDKIAVQEYCARHYTNASALIKTLLIKEKIIAPCYFDMD